MRPEERDPRYVWDMLEAARSVREDRKLQLAVERALEIIGGAGAGEAMARAASWRTRDQILTSVFLELDCCVFIDKLDRQNQRARAMSSGVTRRAVLCHSSRA